jgi:hexosaminidase
MRLLPALLFALTLPAPAAPPPDDLLNLMPRPSSVVLTEGKLRVTGAFAVAPIGDAGLRPGRAAARFMERLAGRTGIFFEQDFLALEGASERAAFLYKYERPGTLEPGEDESYAITVSPDRVLLVAATDLGVLHGFETLLQLLADDAEGFFIPCVQIRDAPRFVWRGLLIDSGRHFMPVDVIKRNLDGLAAVKMNVFHWHLTEDQGFRVESKVFPKLHELGSDGFFYTQAQIREVVAYAAERGIRVMPEFDIPGHSTSWFAAFPELASGPGPYRVERRFGIMDPTFHPGNPAVFAFFDKFFGEMAALFPDPFLHIGGDENTGKEWDANPEIRQFKREKSLSDNHALQAFFNGRILQILKKHGRRMVGWDEIFQPGLPKDIVIQSWRGIQALHDAARQGYAGLLSNGYYIDLCQPAGFHYGIDPVPEGSGLPAEASRFVLGGEATMWTELVSPETVDSRIWPRTAAIAERLWSAPNVRDAEDMYRRLDVIALGLEELGLTHLKNQDMMLRRLAGSADIAALKILAEVVEPVKIYQRQNQGVAYTQLSPLTRFVDAVRPESASARAFGKAVDSFLATRKTARAAEIRAYLSRWKAQRDALKSLIARAPALREIAPLSEALAEASRLGSEAVDRLLAKAVPDASRVRERLEILKKAKRPMAHAEIAVIGAIEKLVRAAGA